MWKTQRSTVKGYFLAGGQMVWWPVSTPVLTLPTALGCSHTDKHICLSTAHFSKQEINKQTLLPRFAKAWFHTGFFSPDLRLQGEAQPDASQNLVASGDFQNSLGVPTKVTALC